MTASICRLNKFRDERLIEQRHHRHLVTKTVINVLKDNTEMSNTSLVNEIRDECH